MARAPAKPAVPGRKPRQRQSKAAAPAIVAAASAADQPVTTPKPARKRAARPAPAPEPLATEPERKPKLRVTLPSLESGSTRLRKVILNFAFVLAILIFIPILASQFLRNPVLIEPIAVPKALLARGMTPEVLASRLWDGLQDARALAGTSKTSLDAIPNSQRVEFSVPEVGLSLDSIIRQTRRFFNLHQTTISGEFVCADTTCATEGMQLRLRVSRGTTEVVDMPPLGPTGLRPYFRDAAIEVLSTLDPYVAVAAIASTERAKAITLARRLIRQGHADSKWAYMLIGNIRSESGDDRAAVPEYQAALAIDGSFFVAKANLAAALRRLGDPVAARKLYDELAAAAPDNAKPQEGYAELAAGAGRFDEAIALFKQAAEKDPSYAFYYARIGQIEQGRGNMDDARLWYHRALDVDPAFPVATEALFIDYFSRGDVAASEPILRAAADFAPDDVLAQSTYAIALMFMDRPADALAAFDRALALTPDDPELLFQTGKLLQALDRQDESIERLNRAIALDPYNPAPLMSRGTAFAVTGFNVEARADFERIIDVDTTGLYAPQAATFITIVDGLIAAAEAEKADPAAEAPEASP